MLSIKNKLVLLLFVISAATQAMAQEDLRRDAVFFENTLTTYQMWLDSSNLSTYLSIGELSVDSNELHLELKTTSKDSWITLREYYQTTYGQALAVTLFQKAVFQMEIDRSQITMTINGEKDAYQVNVFWKENKVQVRELLYDVVLRGGIQVNLKGLSQNGKTKTTRDLKETKKLIRNYFKGYYEKQEVWGRNAKFEVIEFDDILAMEISDIKREILYDFTIGYFEMILIDMQFTEVEEVLEINYTIQGKYGSGVFIAPRRSGYKDMEPKFIDYLERYQKWFRSELEQLLASEIIRN